LRRTPRQELPEPPVVVQLRAVNPRQPLSQAPVEKALTPGEPKQ
jgi:hypothetical protein